MQHIAIHFTDWAIPVGFITLWIVSNKSYTTSDSYSSVLLGTRNLFVLRNPVFYLLFVSNIIYEYVIPWVGNLTEVKSLPVQRDLQYGDFGSDNVLKMQSVNFLIIT